MTRTTNARIAGVAYLLYIAVGYPSMLLSDRATSGDSVAAKLANMLGLTCRVAEGVPGAASIPTTLGLLAVATAAGTSAPDPAAAGVLVAFVLNQPWLIAA